ncbi:MAG: hypothetical protein DWG83_00905 [Chloroflexi bacterium]|nr:hypothetical protein [Chloroflexota bacterium]MDA1240866.1 hypothetical protein [Chloroflexota bacterium]MQC19119.1 hypothetical protein [Chloroflexota bacterium]
MTNFTRVNDPALSARLSAATLILERNEATLATAWPRLLEQHMGEWVAAYDGGVIADGRVARRALGAGTAGASIGGRVSVH